MKLSNLLIRCKSLPLVITAVHFFYDFITQQESYEYNRRADLEDYDKKFKKCTRLKAVSVKKYTRKNPRPVQGC